MVSIRIVLRACLRQLPGNAFLLQGKYLDEYLHEKSLADLKNCNCINVLLCWCGTQGYLHLFSLHFTQMKAILAFQVAPRILACEPYKLGGQHNTNQEQEEYMWSTTTCLIITAQYHTASVNEVCLHIIIVTLLLLLLYIVKGFSYAHKKVK